MLPEWFKLTPGFRFFDHDGHLCVLLGWEPEGQVLDKNVSVTVNGETTVARSVELTLRMTYAYWCKNTWHLDDSNALVLFNEDDLQPCPDDHPILKMLITKRTTKYMSSSTSVQPSHHGADS